MKKQSAGLFRRLYDGSLILSFLTAVSVWLHTRLSRSIPAKIFCAAAGVEEAKNRSFLARIFSLIPGQRIFLAVKKRFSYAVEDSFFVSLYRMVIRGLLHASARSAGIFFFSFGAYSAASFAIKVYFLSRPETTQGGAVTIALLLLLSLPLLLCRRTVAELLLQSRFLSFLLFDLLGLNRLTLDDGAKPEKHGTAAFALGTVFGLLSFAFSPVTLLICLGLLIFAAVVLFSPESGLFTCLICLPFAGKSVLGALLTLTAFSYLLKLLRGKRNISFTTADILVLLFGLTCFLSDGSAMTTLLALVLYFLLVNLLRNKNLFENSLNALALGLFLCMGAQFLTTVFTALHLNIHSFLGFAFEFSGGDSPFLAITSLLVGVGLFSYAQASRIRFFGGLLAVLACNNLALAMSDGVWLTALLALLLCRIFCSARPLNVLLGMAILITPLLFLRTLAQIYNTVTPLSFGSFTGGVVNARNALFGGGNLLLSSESVNLFGRLFSAGGIFLLLLLATMLFFVLQRCCSTVRQAESSSVRTVCGCAASVLLAFLLYGTMGDLFADARLTALFYLFLALCSASFRAFSKFFTGTEEVA